QAWRGDVDRAGGRRSRQRRTHREKPGPTSAASYHDGPGKVSPIRQCPPDVVLVTGREVEIAPIGCQQRWLGSHLAEAYAESGSSNLAQSVLCGSLCVRSNGNPNDHPGGSAATQFESEL